MDKQDLCFVKVVRDVYHGIHIQAVEPVNDDKFIQLVLQITQAEITINEQQSPSSKPANSIWITLKPPKLHLVGTFCQQGFEIHQGKGLSINLKKWIAPRKDLIPPFSEFIIGCGAVIIKNNSIFLVQEKSGDRKGRFNIPGGRADPGQLIHECVVRELFEETNMRGRYRYIIGCRQTNHNLYDSVDLYFPCYLEVDDLELQNIKLCEREIKGYRWVHLSEYYNFLVNNNGTATQLWVADCITKAWKNGFKFEHNLPNLTFNTTIQAKGMTINLSYHNLIANQQVSEKGEPNL